MKIRILLLALLLLPAFAAEAAPRWVRISLPADNPESSENVAWNTDDKPDNNTVEYGTAQNALTSSATGKSFTAKGKLGIGHEVALTGLQPDTQYFYRVGGNGEWSAVHSFKTAPKPGCGPFKFIASGDHRSDDTAGPNPKWASILGEMAATGANFILETGDLVHDGNDVNQWWNHMEMAAAKSGEFALMPSFGNHDSDSVQGASAAFNQIWALPSNNASNSEDFYAYTYGNAVFVALSTATYDDTAGLAMQAKWLDETLTKYADKTWKFVYFHHPCYTSYINLTFIDLNHPPDEKKQNAVFVPIFDKHHVDIVFAGHNHFYERFAPMKGGNVVATPADGTVYITTGGAGAFTYDTIDVLGFKIEPMKVICGDGFMGFSGKAKGSQMCTGKHHYIEVAIDGGSLTATVRATAAQNLGTNDANKGVIETYKISKTAQAGVNCTTVPANDFGGAPDAGTSPDTSAAADIAAEVVAAPDSTAAPDSAPAPDTAAAPDVAKPADTVAAKDTAVAPDTAAAPDAAPAPDAAAAADAAPAPDTAAAPDAAAAPDTASGDDADVAATAKETAAVADPGATGGTGISFDTGSSTSTSSKPSAASSSSCTAGGGSSASSLLALAAAMVGLAWRRRCFVS